MPTKAPFKTPYGERTRYHIPTGNGIENEYGYEIDKFGRKILVKTGESNLYEKIQESAEICKIENILKSASIGDMSNFRPDGIYMDTTEIPNNMIEVQKQIQNMENTWNALPNEIKEKYNYDKGEFIGASGSERWLKDLGLIEEPTLEPTPEPTLEKGEPTNE